MANPAISEWADMMSDSVVITPKTGRAATGGPTYTGATPATYKAYIEMSNHLIVDRQGREILAKGRVYLATTTVVGVEDQVTLPVGYVPRTPPILAVNIVNDDTGNHHVELEIG